MTSLGLHELDEQSSAYDRVVDASDLPDPFCTGSAWVLPAKVAFAPEARSRVMQFPEGYAPLMELETGLGRTWLPLEASWGLAAAVFGPEPRAIAERFFEAATAEREAWDALFLSGLTRGGAVFSSLIRRFGRRSRLGLGQPTVRCVASLDGGWDGYLSRRSPAFRKNLRRIERRADGTLRCRVLAPSTPAEALSTYAEVLSVERASWKSAEGHGIEQGPMRTFYAEMVPRLARRGELRVTFAEVAGERVGYVLGGVRNGTYRGLQISFDDAWRDLSVGNLLQAATIRALAAEGVGRYDLGTDMAYKAQWSEERVETVPLVVR